MQMKAFQRTLLIAAWVAVVTIACLAFAFGPYSSIAGALLAVCGLALQRKEELTKKQSPKGALPMLLCAAIVIGIMIWGAFSGTTTASNEWFRHSPYRPLIALGTWLLFLYGAYLVFRARFSTSLNTPPAGSVDDPVS
jgi:MFS family permease